MNNTRLFLSPPHMGGEELELVREAFASNYIAPLGPMVDAFEREFAEYTGIPHCLALASGTAAMHLALRELSVGPGDEVLASTHTFIGSVSPVTFLGGSLAFIDSDPATWNMDPVLLSEELAVCAQHGKLPKAVIPTDLYGQCADLPGLRAICDPYGVPIVSDSAEAMGAFYETTRPQRDGLRTTDQGPRTKDQQAEVSGQWSVVSGPAVSGPVVSSPVVSGPAAAWHHAGWGAKAAVYSFNGNKIMTTSGGGMLASHDKHLVEHARKLSQQARDPAPYYEHSEIGYNYRMSNILAAIGRGQLRVLEERVAAKRRIFEHYQGLLGDLPGITFMPEAPTGRSNRWLTVIQIDPAQFGTTSEQVRLALEAENIESRPVWKPMHLQPVFRSCRIRGGSVSERLFQLGFCLPSGTAMTPSDIERVASIVRRCHASSPYLPVDH
ncbi:MAG: DegT/DnrJ/EryC1/StrS family aminotransferase [Verrucomicrobiota bacterium]|jgi:dTDP-4-amino-4,6-dideoxygalactose transaminase